MGNKYFGTISVSRFHFHISVFISLQNYYPVASCMIPTYHHRISDIFHRSQKIWIITNQSHSHIRYIPNSHTKYNPSHNISYLTRRSQWNVLNSKKISRNLTNLNSRRHCSISVNNNLASSSSEWPGRASISRSSPHIRSFYRLLAS